MSNYGLLPIEVEHHIVKCQAHRFHNPEPIGVELHHIIPRAWQIDDAGNLSYPATVALCRTGHGNVHRWLGKFMRTYELYAGESGEEVIEVVDEAIRVVKKERLLAGWHANRKEIKIARESMAQWLGKGHSLRALCSINLYGDMYG